jgi:hypothetical protein
MPATARRAQPHWATIHTSRFSPHKPKLHRLASIIGLLKSERHLLLDELRFLIGKPP